MPANIPPTVSDRLLQAFRALVRAEDPNRTFRGLYEYAVQATGSGTVDAIPTDATISLPQLTKVPILTGIAGASCTPSKGSRLAVAFLNGDPTRPVVIGSFDSTAAQSVTFNGGTGTSEHLMTVEATVNLIWQTFVALAARLSGSWTGSTVAGALTAALNAAIAASAGTSIVLFDAALLLALAAKTSDAAGTSPGVGCPNLKGG